MVALAKSGGPKREPWPNRFIAAVVAVACLSVLLVAASLSPDPRGFGTHTGLGIPPCGWPAQFGRPCATCGMTTAFSLAVRGRFLESLHAQPFGTLLCVVSAAGFWLALHAAATGSRIGRLLMPMVTLRAAFVWIGLLLAAWVYKILTWPVV
ncbi:MAG: DUF2752 domain-containing protein [Phycisphaerales bacterium]|nr:DUF2752 domain-containing protein [Phycisphaerales bacterium]